MAGTLHNAQRCAVHWRNEFAVTVDHRQYRAAPLGHPQFVGAQSFRGNG